MVLNVRTSVQFSLLFLRTEFGAAIEVRSGTLFGVENRWNSACRFVLLRAMRGKVGAQAFLRQDVVMTVGLLRFGLVMQRYRRLACWTSCDMRV